ncbi:hypothetical protein OBBRIDRAFT_737990, partial [Obba rivulosa]
ALCCYDYCITFRNEVRYIWTTKLSFATALFYVARYSALFNTIFVIGELYPSPGQNNLVSFSSLRVYAVYGRNTWVGVVTLSLGLCNPTISLVSIELCF